MSRSLPGAEQPDGENNGEPRRGGRVRKQVDRFDPGTKKAREVEDATDQDSDESDEEARPARKKRATVATKAKTTKSAAPRKKRQVSEGEANGEGVESQIKTDCPLYNALTSADIALQPLIEDWVDTYQSTASDETSEKTSVHELVTFIVRCCGLNSDIEEYEAVDSDGIVDAVERVQDESVQTTSVIYPLIAKTKEAKTFRSNLALFVPHLIKILFLTDIPYETDSSTKHSTPLLPLVLNWLHSMSTSPLRPIRHTSTHIALKVCSALCDVASDVSKDLSLKQRQRDAEAKKAGNSTAMKKKVAQLEVKVAEVREKKERLEEYMQEIFDVMFVHRVRDSDPLIRRDCLGELGVWCKKYGEMYVGKQPALYFVRGCNDPDSKARLETVKALPSLLIESNRQRARTNLLRLAPRLVEMALRDVDLNIRVNALHIVTEIDKIGLFEDDEEDQRSVIARLVFDSEPKMRRAAAPFIREMWKERLEQLQGEWGRVKGVRRKRAGEVTEDEMEQRLGYKALAQLLLETAQSLEETKAGSSKVAPIANAQAAQAGRAGAAVDALWDTFEELQTWEGLGEYLLLDHADNSDMWLLEEDEESLLLHILVACIKKEDLDDEDDKTAQTTTLMNILPRLYKQHQADPDRMTGLLAVPQYMSLLLYQGMGKTSAYEGLWDDITKQFLQQNDLTLLTAAIKAVVHLTNNGPEAVNKTKLIELDETVFASLRDAINGEDVYSMSMDEDKLEAIQGILLRISLLQRSRDIVEVMQDEEGGQSSGWEIVLAFAQRGEVGYKEEAKVVEHAIQIVFLHLTWLFKKFTEENAGNPQMVEEFRTQRDQANEVFEKLALRERANSAESVRRQAFISFLNLHILFSAKNSNALPAARAVPLKMEDEVQHRLGGAFTGAAERYASDMEEYAGTAGDDDTTTSASVEKAQHELTFLQLVSVFVGAIRCSVLDVEQAREPLSYYGRFGATYDAIVKKLVDPLRDEGIYNKEATTVQNIAGSALQASFGMFLDSSDEEPVATIALAKMVSQAFTVQGTHFVVLKQIHPTDVHDLHLSSIDWIVRKLTAAIRTLKTAKAKSAKDHAHQRLAQTLTFFKVLPHLLGPVTGHDAIKIRDHLEEAVSGTGATVSPTHKSWEGYRAYEKRLMTVASKDPTVKVVAQAKKARAEKEIAETEASDDEDAAREETPGRDLAGRRGASLAGIEVDGDEAIDAAEQNGAEDDEADGAGQNEDETDGLENVGDISGIGEEILADGGQMDLDLDLDLGLDALDDGRARSRSRSMSEDRPPAPPPKRRKTVKRY